ncbi:hypothetical protein PhaeoP97_00216 [Phaeobacter porticola]|uniref:Uncharacterized protein n=1 Tax=Phaeobacter porticola TaxID=1844006 RepID=A0A1L3I0N4_9RHOB|nr:hypothetical protein PhaeoP97_00216 [Phaeobacter porticola]
MRDLRVCEGCGAWREKLRACETCGFSDFVVFTPEPRPTPEGNSRSLRRMLKSKRRK